MDTSARAGFLLATVLLFGSVTASAQDGAPGGPPQLTEAEREILIAGVEAHDRGEFAAARDHYGQLLDVHPDHPIALYQIAFAYQGEGRLEDCATYARRSASVPSSVRGQALGLQGACLDMMGRHHEALAVFSDAILEEPDRVQFYHSTAIIHINLGDPHAAVEALTEAIEIDPAHPGSHLLLAQIRMDQGRNVGALLGFSYFLMFEPYSERAQDATNSVRTILSAPASVSRDGGGTTTQIVIGEDGLGLTAAETILALVGAARQTLDLDADRLEIERLYGVFETVLAAVPSEAPQSRDPISTLYIPFFSDLYAAGHAQAFFYLTMESSGLEGIDTWLTFNEEAVDDFIDWLED